MKNKREMCSVSSGKDESQSVLYILRVEDAISMRIAFTTFVGQPYTYSFDLYASHRYSLARSGCRPFLNEGSMIFPPRCSRSRWWDLTSVRFPVSFYNYTLCSRRWSRCPPMLPLVVSLFLLRGFTLHLILPSGYYFDLRIYECFQFVLRLCHHFHHVYVAT